VVVRVGLSNSQKELFAGRMRGKQVRMGEKAKDRGGKPSKPIIPKAEDRRRRPKPVRTGMKDTTRRKGEPARAATPDGLPRRGGEAPEIPSPTGPTQRGGEGQGVRPSEGLPKRGGEEAPFEDRRRGCRPMMDTAAMDQAQRSKGYSCSNMRDGPGVELTLDYDEWVMRPISLCALTIPEALRYAEGSEASDGILAVTVGPTDRENHVTPEDGACTISSCFQGEDAKELGEARPLKEYDSASKSADGRAHSIAFIQKVIEVLKSQREPDSDQSPLKGRLAIIATYYEPPGHIVSSKNWLNDEDIEVIHQALGTSVAIWNTDQSRTRGRLIRPQMHMSAAEAANFLATPRTWIEASPSHYTCFGHSVGKLEDLPDHTPMGGTVQAETLRQAAFLLVRASQNREEIKKKIEAQRSNPREARIVARKAVAAAAAAKKGVVKNIRHGSTKTHRGADQVRLNRRPTPAGKQRRHRAQQGPPWRRGEGQGPRTSEGSPRRGGKPRRNHQLAFPTEGEKNRGRRDQ
jgi:hypothetical protein